jgi:hypothetical protein
VKAVLTSSLVAVLLAGCGLAGTMNAPIRSSAMSVPHAAPRLAPMKDPKELLKMLQGMAARNASFRPVAKAYEQYLKTAPAQKIAADQAAQAIYLPSVAPLRFDNSNSTTKVIRLPGFGLLLLGPGASLADGWECHWEIEYDPATGKIVSKIWVCNTPDPKPTPEPKPTAEPTEKPTPKPSSES